LDNCIEDKTRERKTPRRTNFDRLLIEFNFLIVVMRVRASVQQGKMSSVCDQLLGLDRKMMIRRTHKKNDIIHEDDYPIDLLLCFITTTNVNILMS
jgi:hypothetical protein